MGYDVILVNVVHGLPIDNGRVRPPLGLLYVGSVLQQDGFSVRLLDLQNPKEDALQVPAFIAQEQPVWVGFGTDSDNVCRVLRLRDRVLAACPSTVCVLGGPHVSQQPERYVSRRTIVVCGEGEYPALLLSRVLGRGEGNLHSIPSICFQDPWNPEAEACESEPGDLRLESRVVRAEVSNGPFRDLGKIPHPDYSLLEARGEYIRPAMITARGCPYTCRFCVEGASREPYRERPLTDIEGELVSFREQHDGAPVYAMFLDDTFTATPRRTEELCDVIDRVFPDKAQFGFYCEGRANVLAANPSLMFRLKAAGLMRLQIGIESATQRLLDQMNKRIQREHTEAVIRGVVNAEVQTAFGCFLLGLPEQTEEDVRESIRFAKHLIDVAPGRFETEPSILCPFAGTEYRENAELWGLKILDPEFVTGESCRECFAETKDLASREIRELHALFHTETQRYYLEALRRVSSQELKAMVIATSRFKMVPLAMRLLSSTEHIGKLLRSYESREARFVQEVGVADVMTLCPWRCSDEAKRVGEKWLVNERSPFAFFLEKDEMDIYRYFSGKLTFGEIAHRCYENGRGDGMNEESRKEVMARILRVYQKCEDGLTAFVTRW